MKNNEADQDGRNESKMQSRNFEDDEQWIELIKRFHQCSNANTVKFFVQSPSKRQRSVQFW